MKKMKNPNGNKSDFLKKRNRSNKKFSKHSSNDGNQYKIEINKNTEEENINENENVNTIEKTQTNQELVKIGKYWNGSVLIEPKNTSGKITFDENKGVFFSIVGEGLRIFEIENLSQVKERGIIQQENESVVSYCYNNIRRNEIICSMSNSLIRVFNLDTLKCIKTWKLNKVLARVMKIDPAGKFLAIASTEHSLFIYDLSNYSLVSTFTGHTNFVYDLAFNPDKEKFILYSASEDGTVKVWDIILNKLLVSLEGHATGVRHIVLTNDGKSLISVSSDSNIVLWKLSNNTVIKSFTYNKPIDSMIYFTKANDRELTPCLLIGSEDGSIDQINLKNNSATSVNFIKQSVIQIYFSPNSKKIYALTSDQTIIHLKCDLVNEDISKAELVRLYPGYCQELLDIKTIYNPEADSDVKNFLFSSNDNMLKFYQQQGDTLSSVKIFEGHKDFIMNIEVKKNIISTASKDNTIRLWKFTFENGNFECRCFAVLKGHSEAVNSTGLLLKKGLKVVSGSKDKSIKVWDLTNVSLDHDKVFVIKQSLHSQTLAHEEEVNLVKVSHNEKLIASGSYDKTIKVWNEDLEHQGTITGHKRAITDLSFSKYAKVLASSSTDKTVKLWNLNDYSCINTLQGHLASVLRLQWIYYGTHILSAGADGLFKIWNIKSSECINTMDAHEGKIWALDLTDKNENMPQFITGGTDSKIILWTDTTQEKENNELLEQEEKIMKEERLRILNDNREFYHAMQLSLELNRKNDFVNTFKYYINDTLSSNNLSLNRSDPIQEIINNRKIVSGEIESEITSQIENKSQKSGNIKRIIEDKELRKIILNKKNLHKILEIIRDNNIISHSFAYMQILLKIILISTNYQYFINSNKNSKLGLKNKGFRHLKSKKEQVHNIDFISNFEIIKSYSEKHLERVNRELTKAYLLEYIIEKMKII